MSTKKKKTVTRKTKTVITDWRRVSAASSVLAAALGVCGLAVAQDDKAQDDKNQSAKSEKAEKNKNEKPYGLIFGTAFGPDDRPGYGVRVTIHPAGKKRPTWDLVSDHHGEFAHRVPPGPGDYEANGEGEIAPVENGKPQVAQKKRWKGECKVHIDVLERREFRHHLSD